ncbi:hypothetical protein [Mycobacterium servetii]|uniref:Uncharacterized protein n=1 Tax=Mycobacterium servetii TaxID=3237418 RepID=A0ABV4C6F0_9MYCO
MLTRALCGLAAAAALIGVIPMPPAHAGPVQWCDPSSPLFDPTICYNESPSTGSYACDPYGPAYNANYCASQGAQ